MDKNNDYPDEAFCVLDHLKPSIRISPSYSSYLASMESVKTVDKVSSPNYWLDDGEDILFLMSGRQAITVALVDIGLSRGDEVLIVTTTQGSYVSSCVTQAIEDVCGWSRVANSNTKAVLLIHEFGFPCVVPENVASLNLPIIEDCAYAIGTRISGAAIAQSCDYAVYSLPKYFPLPFGGVLVAKKSMCNTSHKLAISKCIRQFLVEKLSIMASESIRWNSIRLSNWNYFQCELKKYAIEPYFHLTGDVIPGVFVLKLSLNQAKYLPSLKKIMVGEGIESTEYYGHVGYFFPIHQFLSDYDKKYICYHFKRGLGLQR